MGVRTAFRQRDLLLGKKNRAAVVAGASLVVVLLLLAQMLVFEPEKWAKVRERFKCFSEVRFQLPRPTRS
jgi:hypothetical protein